MQELTLYVPDSRIRADVVSVVERQLIDNNELLQERIAALEFALEDEGWQLLTTGTEREFSRQGLQKIINRSRLMYLSNPMIRRPVDVQANYVFGQGVEFEAEDPDINELVQAFLDDPANRAEFSSHQAMTLKEIDLSVEGNVFFAFFSDPSSGAVRVRSLPVDEVQDVVCNPEDAKEPWFYRRVWAEHRLTRQGTPQTSEREAFYPDWRYRPKSKRPSYGGKEIVWDVPVQHVKVGGLSSMRFGVPETYPALDWAKAYKEALEDDATRSRALARFAMKLTTQGSAASIQKAKEKLQTTYGNSPLSVERNPPPNTASTFIGRKDAAGNVVADLEPVKLDGTMLPADHARPFRLMVCAAMGLPETYFGDADVGNHATAKTMDRPTELMMEQRRRLWGDVFSDMFAFVIRAAVRAPGGGLRGKYKVSADGGEIIALRQKAADDLTATVAVNWPSLLEHDVSEQITAIVAASTLGGHGAQPVLGVQTVARLMLSVMGVKDIDEKITQWFGDAPDALPEIQAPPPPIGGVPPPFGEADTELRMRGILAQALREAMSED